MRRIQNKNVQPDLSFLEIKGTVLKRLRSPHKDSRCLPGPSCTGIHTFNLGSILVFEKRNSFVSFRDARKLLVLVLRWGVDEGGFAWEGSAGEDGAGHIPSSGARRAPSVRPGWR